MASCNGDAWQAGRKELRERRDDMLVWVGLRKNTEHDVSGALGRSRQLTCRWDSERGGPQRHKGDWGGGSGWGPILDGLTDTTERWEGRGQQGGLWITFQLTRGERTRLPSSPPRRGEGGPCQGQCTCQGKGAL